MRPSSFWAMCLVGRRSVGGYVISPASQGRIAGEDVMKILGGENPQKLTKPKPAAALDS
jgi:hypothetical protein